MPTAGATQCFSCILNGEIVRGGGGDGDSCRLPVANAARTACGELPAHGSGRQWTRDSFLLCIVRLSHCCCGPQNDGQDASRLNLF